MDKFVTYIALISVLVMTMIFGTVHADSGSGSTSNSATMSATGFSVDSIEVTDDRTVKVHFTDTLAQEPVNLKLFKTDDDAEVTVDWVDIEPDRLTVIVHTASVLSRSTQYSVVVLSALSMKWEKITQTEDADGVSFSTENTLPVYSSGSSSASSSPVSLDSILPKKNITAESSSNNNKSTSAPPSWSLAVSGSSLKSAASANVPTTSETIASTSGKRLPKTGPEEIVLILLSLFIAWGMIFLHTRENRV